MDYIFILTALVVISFNIGHSSAAPVSSLPTGEPWKTPCSGSSPVVTNPALTLPSPTISVTERLNSLILKFKDTIELSSSLKQKIGDLLQNTELVTYLEHDTELLQGFPSVVSDTLSLKENLVIDNERFAALYIFFEQSAIDSEFKSDFKIYSNKILNILCEIQTISSHEKQEIVSKVSRKVMLDGYRTLSSAHRMERDYIILRDTTKILESVINVYNFHAAHYS
ncbi:hypothetical protein LOTGIDRAFT_174017 [Lottia gigantea]|uniref:Uncharacterized protein n=1 Tax=Lottia gigantea TaxID=225164 RepID=V4AP96_LOTGI|nr:hypothetical protein LOTGIDRAFT_174017 [Lottia gigantea]ESO99017.1 hypothetical protein LOTGIDRAFT_174017 [Lottia gigantea]